MRTGIAVALLPASCAIASARTAGVEVRPVRATVAPKLDGRLDDQAIYFAFRCYDADPGRIRTAITRRDNAWNDDWVAISLDSSRAGQVAYHMFINPNGIQMDALNTASGEDSAVAWTWQSAGRIDEEGDVVEVRVPLQSIRFRGGDEVRMGVMF